MRSQRLTGLLLTIILIILLLFLISCAAGGSDGNNGGGERAGDSAATAVSSTVPGKSPGKVRLLLGRNESSDSVTAVTDFFVDQALRQALDSIPAAEYIRLNVRDSLTEHSADGKGIAAPQLGRQLGLDGLITTRVVRFSSILAVELRITDPVTSRPMFRDVAYGLIRYRDTSEMMLLGPTLSDLVRQLVGRYFKIPHTAEHPIISEPLIIGSIVIAKDPALGQISANRDKLSSEGVKALGEFARLHFPELVAFDYESRRELYKTVGISAVEDFMAVGNQERRALFNVGMDRFVVGSVSRAGDSIRLRLELRYLVDAQSDTLQDVEERRFPRAQFENTRVVEETVIGFIDLAESLYKREATRLANEYAHKPSQKQ
jgi:hypothetical protein